MSAFNVAMGFGNQRSESTFRVYYKDPDGEPYSIDVEATTNYDAQQKAKYTPSYKKGSTLIDSKKGSRL